MRIVYLNPSSSFGGGERSLLDLMASFRAAEPSYELHLAVPDDGPLVGAARELGVTVHVLSMPAALIAWGDSALRGSRGAGRLARYARFGAAGAKAALGTFRYVLQLRAFIRSLKPDIVHSNGLKLHFLAAVAMGKRRPSRPPLVWHARDFFGQRQMIVRGLRRVAKRVSLIIGISEAVSADVRRELPGVEVKTVLNAIDLEAFSAASEKPVVDLDALAGVAPTPPGTVRIGLVATYARWKGQDIFLSAAAEVLRRRSDPPFRFYIVGGPIYQTAGSQWSREELLAMAAEKGVAGKLTMVDFVRDPATVFRALDVVVHASAKPEPFGRTIAEAMACGRAVIASGEGGAVELFVDGVEALSFKPGDPADLANRIIQLAESVELREKLGAAAQDAARLKYDRLGLAPRVGRLYNGLVSHP